MHKDDFPLLQREINSKKIIYLNSAATSQKPKIVIDSVNEYYSQWNANLHRGSDILSNHSEEIFECARNKVAEFLNAHSEEIVFTKNCTESINLVARGLEFKSGDKIVVSIAEHHANFIPWKMLEKLGVIVEVLDVDDAGKIVVDESKILGARLVAIHHISNALGTKQDVQKICTIARKSNTLVLVDAAQSVGHIKLDVQELDCDFLTFSGHKMLALNGVGVLYGKKECLNLLSPLLYGGDMIRDVSLEQINFADAPRKFEAGTQDVASVYSLLIAIEYLESIGFENVEKHISEVTNYAIDKMSLIDGVKILGQGVKNGLVSFNLGNIHPHDVAEFLVSKGIIVRSGHLCCQPLMKRFDVDSVVRASFYLYNEKEDIDAFVVALQECKEFFENE